MVRYHAFSDDGRKFLHGTQSVTEDVEQLTLNKLEWHSNLTWTGKYEGSQVTSPDGSRMSIDALKNLFEANGTLEKVVGGVEYGQPGNGQ
jgi:folate-binding Fe-S cluster repair protein YgfZ